MRGLTAMPTNRWLCVCFWIIFNDNVGVFAANDPDKYKIYAVPLNGWVDLQNVTKLYNFKNKHGEDISRNIYFEKRHIGEYLCFTMDDRFHVFLIGKESDLKFETVPPNIEGALVGDTISFTCSVKFFTSDRFVDALLKIHRTRRLREHVSKNRAKDGPHELKMDLTFNVTKTGKDVFKCTFEYSIKQTSDEEYQPDFTVFNADVLNITIPVYLAPQEVIPNSTVVRINEAIECSSISEPPTSEHSWNCTGEDWEAVDRILRLKTKGKHLCTCIAKLTIMNKLFEAEWTGPIYARGYLFDKDIKLLFFLVIGIGFLSF